VKGTRGAADLSSGGVDHPTERGRRGGYRWVRDHRDALFFAVTVGLLAAGGGAFFLVDRSVATGAWVAATLLGLVYSTVTIAAAVRRRKPSVDIIAWLALAGALLVDEAFAGAVIAVMLATGTLLESRAAARARRELSLLASRAPRTARRVRERADSDRPEGHRPDSEPPESERPEPDQLDSDVLEEVPVAEVAVGDRLLVGSGEIVPVDGRLLGPGVFDESALTGEPLPVERSAGQDVRSGIVNAGRPVELVATATAAESTYAGVVRLVEQAQAASAPFVRVADRFAIGFVPLTLALAGGAWGLSGDAVRAVAVLVVATPCPLLLAAPIAFMSGLSRAARHGVVVKGGAALEQLAAGRALLFDKTGTLTVGRPVLTDVVTAEGGDADAVLRLAASLDQASAHVVAGSIVRAARERGLALTKPQEVHESPGQGIEGRVDGRSVRLGNASWIGADRPPAPWVRRARRRAELEGSLTVFVGIDGEPAGVLLMEDPVRPDAPRMVRALRAAGIDRVALITGDRADVAETVGRLVGIDAVYADRDPGQKLAIVRDENARAPAVMVGDGVNDAPALAAAGVGVALAARGATASAEAADVVLTVDRIDALADAILIARRARRIAFLAVGLGMGLSLVAMAVAAAGLLAPAVGAVLQEGIDVTSILVALTALLPTRSYTTALSPAEIATARALYDQHRAVAPLVDQVRAVADALSSAGDRSAAVESVRTLVEQLENRLLPHERAEDVELLPILARAMGGTDPTGAFSRTHSEIAHYVSRLRRVLTDLESGAPAGRAAVYVDGAGAADTDAHDIEAKVAEAEGAEAQDIDAEDIVEMRRLLYGLHAILRLHNAQEEEGIFSLLPEESTEGRR
jgi:ATPase, P-type (transporting), HAD superfamily, subfamily IC/heavy metal translocating P-type ATPase